LNTDTIHGGSGYPVLDRVYNNLFGFNDYFNRPEWGSNALLKQINIKLLILSFRESGYPVEIEFTTPFWI
jgi:hypothetical protein